MLIVFLKRRRIGSEEVQRLNGKDKKQKNSLFTRNGDKAFEDGSLQVFLRSEGTGRRVEVKMSGVKRYRGSMHLNLIAAETHQDLDTDNQRVKCTISTEKATTD